MTNLTDNEWNDEDIWETPLGLNLDLTTYDHDDDWDDETPLTFNDNQADSDDEWGEEDTEAEEPNTDDTAEPAKQTDTENTTEATASTGDNEPTYLQGLDPEQRQAVTSDAKRLAIIAPAGAGKSTTITARAQALATRIDLADNERMYAVCFGKDAATELQGKLTSAHVDMKATTLHSLAMKILGWYNDETGKVKLATLDGEGDYELCKTLREALNKWVTTAKKRYPKSKMTVNKAKKVIEKISNGVKITDAADKYIREQYRMWFRNANRDKDVVVTDYAQAITTATKLLNKEWNDKDLMTADKIDTSDTFPKAAVMLVDEAQDLNKAQQAFIEALRPTWLTAVGDPLQAIYTFQGADPTWLEAFKDKISLQHDYRSTKNIVKQCEAIAQNGMIAAEDAEEGEPVKMHNAQNEAEEDAWIINEAKALIEAGLSTNVDSENGIVVLTRESSRGNRLRKKLQEEGLDDKIEISTVHKYKGLQKAAVFVIGLSEQTWNRDKNDDARNCLYVALSRARKYLYLSYAREEIINNRAKGTKPLRLLNKLTVEEVTTNSTPDDIAKTMSRDLEEALAEEYKNLGIRKKAAMRVAGTYRLLAKRYEEAGDKDSAEKMNSRATDINNCMSLAVFSRMVKKDEDPENEAALAPQWRFKTADQCGKRTCPPCIWRKSKQLELKLGALNWWATVGNMRQHPNEADPMRLQAPLFLTLTVPNVPASELKYAMQIMTEAWRNISHISKRDVELHTKKWGMWRRAIPGWWRTIEITYNEKTKMYHPHMHIYMLATKYYANAYNADDPSMEGKSWVWRNENDHRSHKGSPYYMTSRQWGELWTQAINKAEDTLTKQIGGYRLPDPAENIGYYLVDIRKTYTNTKRQENNVQAGLTEVASQHFNHYIPEDDAMRRASTYVTKQIQILPENVEGNELLDWLDTLEKALNGAQLYSKGGWLKTIDDKANSAGLTDWQAEEPKTADPLAWGTLTERYLNLKETKRREDSTSRATWNGDQYVERAITGKIKTAEMQATEATQMTQLATDMFGNGDDEF